MQKQIKSTGEETYKNESDGLLKFEEIYSRTLLAMPGIAMVGLAVAIIALSYINNNHTFAFPIYIYLFSILFASCGVGATICALLNGQNLLDAGKMPLGPMSLLYAIQLTLVILALPVSIVLYVLLKIVVVIKPPSNVTR